MWRNNIVKSRKGDGILSRMYLKIIAGFAVMMFIPAFFAVAAMGLYQPNSSFAVLMDGKVVGYIDCPSQYGEILKTIYQRAEDYWDCELMINEDIRAVRVDQWVPSCSPGYVLARIDDSATYTASGWAVVIDGVRVVYLDAQSTAQKLLEDVNEYFTPKGANRTLQSRTILENVEVVRVPIDPEMLVSAEEAFELLISGQSNRTTHTVQRGETLSSIARAYNTSVDTLRRHNDIAGDTIGVGRQLHLEASDPVIRVKTVERVSNTESIARPVVYRSNPDISVRSDRVIQSGSDGVREVVYQVESINGQEVSRELVEKVVTREPVARIIMPGSGHHPLRPVGMFRFPLNSGSITSRFGVTRRVSEGPHRGIDISSPRGTPIYAAADGVVTSATYHHSWGYYVRIDHANGYTTIYAHASRFASGIRPGVKVVRGQVIAYVGNTGNSYGNHLHFEVWRNGNLVNPMNFFR